MTASSAQRVAVVTGAGRGIGFSIARRLAENGFAVVVHYCQSADQAAALVEHIQAGDGKAVAIRADVSKRGEAHALLEKAKAAFGRIDVLVNNAGVGVFAPLAEIDETSFEQQFRVNVGGALWCSQAAASFFGADGGRIINIGSVAGKQAQATAAIYSASKAALESLTRVLALELGPKRVTVNVVAPGPVETELFHHEYEQFFLSRTPLGRIGQPKDVANIVAFLASEDGGWITGQVITASGGYRP
jgi:3-oxoacyl-[acyl-carrier protein] reductase